MAAKLAQGKLIIKRDLIVLSVNGDCNDTRYACATHYGSDTLFPKCVIGKVISRENDQGTAIRRSVLDANGNRLVGVALDGTFLALEPISDSEARRILSILCRQMTRGRTTEFAKFHS